PSGTPRNSRCSLHPSNSITNGFIRRILCSPQRHRQQADCGLRLSCRTAWHYSMTSAHGARRLGDPEACAFLTLYRGEAVEGGCGDDDRRPWGTLGARWLVTTTAGAVAAGSTRMGCRRTVAGVMGHPASSTATGEPYAHGSSER